MLLASLGNEAPVGRGIACADSPQLSSFLERAALVAASCLFFTDVNQTNQNVDRTQDQNQSDANRHKPSENTQQPYTQQNTPTEKQRATATTIPENKQRLNPSTSEYGNGVNQKDQSDSNQTDNTNRRLPATAGELPLLALAGFVSLIFAFATRAFAKSNR